MTIRMYGTLWCGDCKRAKKFFGEQRVQYDFVDIDVERRRPALVERPTTASTSSRRSSSMTAPC